MLQLASSAGSASRDVLGGVGLIAFGMCFLVASVGWISDYRNLVTHFYDRARKAWEHVPLVGRIYGKVVSSRQYRYLGFGAGAFFGVALIAAGIASIAQS